MMNKYSQINIVVEQSLIKDQSVTVSSSPLLELAISNINNSAYSTLDMQCRAKTILNVE